jgi:hypothetical protein
MMEGDRIDVSTLEEESDSSSESSESESENIESEAEPSLGVDPLPAQQVARLPPRPFNHVYRVSKYL